VLGVTLKSAWFMSHRIREAMRVLHMGPMGGGGAVVEADETYIGRLEGVPKQKTGGAHKNIVLTLVERGGSARSFHVDRGHRADPQGEHRQGNRLHDGRSSALQRAGP
jgi:hypothetical protein